MALLCLSGLFAIADLSCRMPVSQTSTTVVLLGVDGYSWPLLLRYIRQGQMPATAALINRGVTGRLVTNSALISPIIWTTIATGQPMERHGISGHLINGNPPTSSMRHVRAVWNIVSDHNKSVVVLGYMATWPAEKVRGVMVSDYFMAEDMTDRIYPPHLTNDPVLKPAWYPYDPAETWRLRHFTDFTFDPTQQFDPAGGPMSLAGKPPDVLDNFLIGNNLTWPYMRDETIFRATIKYLDRRRPDLMITYFRGIDYVSHGFWKFMDRKDFPDVPEKSRQSFGMIIEKYYRYMDHIIGRIVETAGPDAHILLVSDHGHGPAIGQYRPEKDLWYVSGRHRPGGVFIMTGPGIGRHRWIGNVDALDICPTMLALMGIPIARDMPGLVRRDFLADGGTDLMIQYVPTYEKQFNPSPVIQKSPAADEEIRAQLSALGYIN